MSWSILSIFFFLCWRLDFKCQLPTPVAQSISCPLLSDSDCHTILWPFAEQWPDTKHGCCSFPLFEIYIRLNLFQLRQQKKFDFMIKEILLITWIRQRFSLKIFRALVVGVALDRGLYIEIFNSFSLLSPILFKQWWIKKKLKTPCTSPHTT